MKLWIPDLNTQIRLTANWTFTLYVESRNSDLLMPAEEKARLNKEYKRLTALSKAIHDDKKNWVPYTEKNAHNPQKFTMSALRTTATTMTNESWQKYSALEKEAQKIYYTLRQTNYGGAKVNKDANPYTLEAGTVLEVDRIYIRKGAGDYSSVTFRIKGGKRSPRFFAKLEDVNNIECEPLGRNLKWPNGRFGIGHRYITEKTNPAYFSSPCRSRNNIPYSLPCEPFTVYCLEYDKVSENGQFHGGFGYKMGEDKEVKKAEWYGNQSTNFYPTLEKFIAATKRQNIPEALVEAFLTYYKEKCK